MMTTTKRDTVTKDTAVTMTRGMAMTRDMDTEDIMVTEVVVDMADFVVAEVAADMAAVDEVVVVVAVEVALRPKAETGPWPGKRRLVQPQTLRMRPTIHLRWSKQHTAVAAAEAVAVLGVDEVAEGAAEEELISST